MVDRKAGPIGFKSRFSILSLLPARHPPLDPFPPPPLPELASRNQSLPPTQSVNSRHPTIVSPDEDVSPAYSEYPLSLYSPPILPPAPLSRDTKRDTGRSKSPASHYVPPPFGSQATPDRSESSKRPTQSKKAHHRPPPLDLTRTKQIYPGLVGVVATAGTLPPSPEPQLNAERQPGEKAKETRNKKALKVREDDPFDVVELESTHRYPSWRGGRVSIKPGQIIPSGRIGGTPTLRGRDPPSLHQSIDRAPTSYLKRDDTYDDRYWPASPEFDSVLHDVVLTPNYLGLNKSPMLPPSPTPVSPTEGHWPLYFNASKTDRATRRKRLLETIRRGSRMLREPRAERSLRDLKEKEAQEMARFRQASKPTRLAEESTAYSTRSPYLHPGGADLHPRRSPSTREWNVGVTWCNVDIKRNKGDDGEMWRDAKKKDQAAKKRKLWKILILVVIVLLAALTIGLCTTLLTRSSDKDNSAITSSTNTTDTEASSSFSKSAYPTPSTTPSRTLQTCLDLFTTSTPTAPLSYPCSDCVPLLSSTQNDYAYSLNNGNATGVGAALQFCALSDIFRATGGNGLAENGWMKDESPCSWSGITCDARGRLTELQMRYPNVPDRVPDSIANLIGLNTLRLMGNTTVPSGSFPTALLSLPNITTIDIEYTGLTAQIASVDFAKAPKLSSLVLVNNVHLGNALPSLNKNNELLTLAVTGQGLVNFTEQALPASLTYLDLSYNSLSGTVPSMSILQSLQTLYLTNNNYTSPPASLPLSLSSLSLTANTNLTGFMPSSICSSSALTSCDLRSTGLRGPNMVPAAMSGIFIPTAVTRTAPGFTIPIVSAPSSIASQGGTDKVCGPCRFV